MKKLIALAVAIIMVLALVPMTMAAQLPDSFTVEDGQTLVYDLVGNTSGTITMNGGSLTINGSGTYTGNITVRGGATLTLNGGKYVGTIVVDGSATVTVGPTVQVLASGWYGLQVNDCDNGDVAPEIEINVYGTIAGAWGGIATNGKLNTITENRVVNIYQGAKIYPLANAGDGTVAIYAAGYMVWNIEGGSFKGETCLSIKSGVWNITGGEFLADGVYADPATANNNGSEDTGAALSITSNKAYAPKTNINITGGTFVSEKGNALYEGIAVKNNVAAATESYVEAITIAAPAEGTAPTFYSEKEAVVIDEAPEAAVMVTGGTYSDNSVDNYAAEDATITINTVKPALSETNSTLVTIKSEVTYTVVIPAVIDFGTLTKGVNATPQAFTVELRDAFLGQGAQIQIKVNSDFTFVEEFKYELYSADGAKAVHGALYCTFAEDGTNVGQATCNTTNMPYAGTFTDTMVFTIDYVANTPDPTVGA